MSGFEDGHPRAYMLQLQEFRGRVDNGWVPFGWHVGYAPNIPELEFDGQDECGDPVWERNANWGLSFTEQEADRNARGGSEGLMPTIDATFAPRPCCHTTGPHHHPACQESK